MGATTRTQAFTTDAPATLADTLCRRAETHPDAVACVFLNEDEGVKTQLTFGELDQQSRAIAARLQGLGASGECVVLSYPPGLEFLSALFGCLYANAVAVPLPVPRLKGSTTQFLGIVRDVDARILLTTVGSMARLTRMQIPALESLICLTTEDTPQEVARAWRPSAIASDAVAYLQYTSGSTANRKGVVVTHANVIANLRGIAERFRHHDDSVGVNWLPHTHDLGLVGGILQPLYHGHLNVMLSPTAFVQQPIRWLNAISRYRGTYSNSPNFGYDLCVRRTTPEQRAALDLASWEVALNGAEPVRRHTIDEFARLFGPCGFRRESMFPAYGLAEATLVVSGGPRGDPPCAIEFDAAEMERDRVVESGTGSGIRSLVCCGRAVDSTAIRIVDPATCEARRENEIGEIWVRGRGVAAGYWHRKDETAQTFQAQIAGGSGESYLRTGDLGFLRDGALFITGRLKDLIIVRGANHYPQDIEWTVEQSHHALRPGCGAAFSVDIDGTEEVIVVYELEREHLRTVNPEELARAARRSVAEEHDLYLHAFVLIKPGSMPRTTSGKIQRRQCRADFLSRELPVVWESTDSRLGDVAPVAPQPPAPATSDSGSADAATELIAWLREYAEERLNSRLMDERRSIAPHVILDFGNRGILGLQVPREYGGRGFTYRETLKVLEQIGAIDETLAMMTIVQNALGLRPIVHHAQTELKAELLPRLASGRELVAFALTEPSAGSNPQGIVSTSTPDGPDGWRLHGQKSWSGTAGWATVINVFVQNRDGDGYVRGITGFAVPRDTKGLRIGPEALTLGVRGMVQNTIYLDGARVSRAQTLGEIGGGMKVAHDAMMQGRLAIGAACVGGMKRCLQLLLRFAERRSISTGRLVENPVLLERMASLSAALASIESLVMRVADALDRGADVPGDVLVVCKMAGSEWLWRAADDVVQFLGGRGYIETNIAAQLLRDARVTRILEGPTEALEMFLGSRLLNDGSALHDFLVQTLDAAPISARLADAVRDIHERCTSGEARFGDGPADARRWACALIGRVATDAVLLAASPRAVAHCQPWAEQRFEASIAAAVAQSSAGAGRFDAAALASVVEGYTASIGDIEQSLAGEDVALDDLLRRPERVSERPAVAPSIGSQTSVRDTDPVAGETAPRVRPRVDASAIEVFIANQVARSLKLPPASINPNRSFFDYGLDSVTTVMLAASLEEWLGLTISPEAIYDTPVIRDFAARVAQQHASIGVDTIS